MLARLGVPYFCRRKYFVPNITNFSNILCAKYNQFIRTKRFSACLAELSDN